jgi:hypothetical protein
VLVQAIKALETYGHHSELLLIGQKQREALEHTNKFPQQINPFSTMPDKGDCYGPMLLSFLEYSAMTRGISVRPASGALLWTAVEVPATTSDSRHIDERGASAVDSADVDGPSFSFVQELHTATFTLDGSSTASFQGKRNGLLLFKCTRNARVITDAKTGLVTGVWGVLATPVQVELHLPGLRAPLIQTVEPNEEWMLTTSSAGPKLTLARKVPFTAPY